MQNTAGYSFQLDPYICCFTFLCQKNKIQKYNQITVGKRQITMTKIQYSKQLAFDLIGDFDIGIYLAQI